MCLLSGEKQLVHTGFVQATTPTSSHQKTIVLNKGHGRGREGRQGILLPRGHSAMSGGPFEEVVALPSSGKGQGHHTKQTPTDANMESGKTATLC